MEPPTNDHIRDLSLQNNPHRTNERNREMKKLFETNQTILPGQFRGNKGHSTQLIPIKNNFSKTGTHK